MIYSKFNNENKKTKTMPATETRPSAERETGLATPAALATGELVMSHSASVAPNAKPTSRWTRTFKRAAARALTTHELMYHNGNPAAFSPGGLKEDLTAGFKEYKSGDVHGAQRAENRAALDTLTLPGEAGHVAAALRAAERQQPAQPAQPVEQSQPGMPAIPDQAPQSPVPPVAVT